MLLASHCNRRDSEELRQITPFSSHAPLYARDVLCAIREVFLFMKTGFSKTLRLLVTLSLLCSISIVAGKYLAIRGGDILRFSFENLPIILSGMLFGPLAGAAVGVVADLIGCVLVGYAINPIITVASAVIGLVSGSCYLLFVKIKSPYWLSVSATVFFSHLIGSVIIKTYGLALFYDMELWVLMLWRLLNYLIVGALEGILVYVLLKNKSFLSAVKPLIKRSEYTK